MRTVRGLYTRLCDPDHLAHAMRQTTRGKRRRADVAWFLFNAESQLRRIGDQLRAGTWRPHRFRVIRIRDPKPRAIAHSLVEDRVVLAAIGMLLFEAWEPRLLANDMACRPGFGTHRARLALQRLLRRHRFVLHLDIRSYFPSIELESLRRVLARRIRDPAFLEVVSHVLEAGRGLVDDPAVRDFMALGSSWPPRGRGLPIGAYTSQVLATHVVLDPLDHEVKRTLKVPGYVRYVDDLFLFGDQRRDLVRWRSQVEAWLHNERDLRLKHARAPVLRCVGTLDALGCRIRRDQILPGQRAIKRLRQRVRAHHSGVAGSAAFQRSLASSMGTLLP